MNKKKINCILILGLNNTGKKIIHKLKKDKAKVIVVRKKINLDLVKRHKPEVIFSLGYRHKIAKQVFTYPKYGCYNIHKSLLPLNKGANPVFWTILNNSPAGISIHKVTNKIDAGPIVAQKRIDYNFSYTADKLYAKLEKEQITQFFQFWNKFKKSKISYKKKLTFKSSYHRKKNFLDFINLKEVKEKNLSKVINFLRAATFAPFQNVRLKKGKNTYNVEIMIKKINKSKKINFGLIKSY